MAGKASPLGHQQGDRQRARAGLDRTHEFFHCLAIGSCQPETRKGSFVLIPVHASLLPAGAGREPAARIEKPLLAPLAVTGITSQTLVELLSCCHPGIIIRGLDNSGPSRWIGNFRSLCHLFPQENCQSLAFLVTELEPWHAVLRVELLR